MLVVLLSGACQPSVPAAQVSTPASTMPALAERNDAPPRATATAVPAVQPTVAPVATAPVLAATPGTTPTTRLAMVPVSTLDGLPTEQRATIDAARAALAAADGPRALELLEPLTTALHGEPGAEVSLLRGQALLVDRQLQAALEAARVLATHTQRPDLVSAAHLLEGQALRGLNRVDEAAAVMRAVAEANPLVAAAVRLELEQMWLEAGRPDQAAVDGQRGLDQADARLLTIELAENLGKAHVALGQTDAAIDAYRQLLTAAGSKGYLGEQLFNLAEGISTLGRIDEAITALRTSIAQFPRSRKAPDAVVLLDKLGGMRPEDRFYAGLIRYYFWNFRGARADFDAYLDALPDGDRAIEARYYRGLSSPPADTTQQLLQLAADVPDDDFAPLALLEAAKAQEELADYAGAESIYDRLVATYPTRDAGLAGAFRRGLARFMRGNAEGALDDWSALLARDLAPALRAQTLYWTARLLETQGDAAGARERYTAGAAVRPVDYYVMRCLVALQPPPGSSDFTPSQVGAADETDLARWFSSHGLDLESAARSASQEPAFVRASALVQHGLFRQANWEHEGFLTTYADKPDRLYWLATRFGSMGLPNAALKLGSAALNAATAEGQVSLLEVPPALGRAASPLAYPEQVTAAARARGLDPLLFTALIHQESDFDAHAESVARARGLTQIIPQTATEIARDLKVPDFQPDDLFRPGQNLRFGAYYFAERIKRNGSVTRALAGYNAGDGNVDNWSTPGREDPDIFAEYIPFPETHDYVERILFYWWLNRYLWAR